MQDIRQMAGRLNSVENYNNYDYHHPDLSAYYMNNILLRHSVEINSTNKIIINQPFSEIKIVTKALKWPFGCGHIFR